MDSAGSEYEERYDRKQHLEGLEKHIKYVFPVPLPDVLNACLRVIQPFFLLSLTVSDNSLFWAFISAIF